MSHPWFNGVDWAAMEQMKVEPPFKPTLESECDTQFFSKEFTGVENHNLVCKKNKHDQLKVLNTELMAGDFECIY